MGALIVQKFSEEDCAKASFGLKKYADARKPTINIRTSVFFVFIYLLYITLLSYLKIF
jgi:hypothetical protein